MNMGIEPFLVATSVNLICAQRLVRRICAGCKEPMQILPQALMDAGYTKDESEKTIVQHGRGCSTCNNTGYKGRVGLYEVMEINDDLRELILVGASALELKKKALETGMITLRRSGLIKVRAGAHHTGRSVARNSSVSGGNMAGITLSELLKKMIEMGGSDLHLSTNSAPRIRVHGKLRPLGYAAIDRRGYQGARLQRADGRAEAPPGRKSGAGLFVRLEEPGAFPRQHLPSARRGGRRLPYDSVGNQEPSTRWGFRPSCADCATSRADWCW